MNRQLTLGSLFDGSGGFPLGAFLNGIKPVWASEIEPFPIRVTTKRFPAMKHYGDISSINGAEVEPVDIITFGSPCTDMSVAGKRSGLDGKQSVLFYEAIRIIKEMRHATNGKYPRFILWENVPGAFSSNKGEDFKAVLDSIVQIIEPSAKVPAPENNRWAYADILLGNGWSVAYRTIDAQHFGVPQRRRRIYLVADFTGESAGDILFECEGMSRDFAPCGSPWKGTPGNAQESSGASIGSVSCLNSQIDALNNSIPANIGDNQTAVAIENHPTDGRCKIEMDGKIQTLTSRMGTGGMNVPLVMNEQQYVNTLTGTDMFKPTPKTLKVRAGCEGGGKGALVQDDISATLSCNNDQTLFVPTEKKIQFTFGICSDKSNSMMSDNPHSGIYEAETSRTLDANGGNPSCNQGGIAVVALLDSMISQNDKNRPQENGVEKEIRPSDYNAIAYSMTTGGFTQVEEDVSPTLLSRDYKDAPVVGQPTYGIDRAAFNQGRNAQYKPSVEEEQQPTLTAKGSGAVAQPASFYPQMKAESQCFRQDGKANTLVNGTSPGCHNGLVEPGYVVRRLTPIECARLQGFPDWWCDGLSTPEPTDEEISWWTDVFETHRKIMGTSKKPKSRKQIVKWLRNPRTDSAEYKMWGNGVALPCVCFTLCGIVDLMRK